MYKSSPLAMPAQTCQYASSYASDSSSESSPRSTSSRASSSSSSSSRASARHAVPSDLFCKAPASDYFSSWPRSDTLFSPPASTSSVSSSSPSSITPSTSSSATRVSSYISDEDLFGLDDLDGCLPYLSEAPAPPRQAHEWEQQFLQPQMVLAEPSHQPLPVLVAKPKVKRTVGSKKALYRSKTSRALPVIKETAA